MTDKDKTEIKAAFDKGLKVRVRSWTFYKGGDPDDQIFGDCGNPDCCKFEFNNFDEWVEWADKSNEPTLIPGYIGPPERFEWTVVQC